MKFEYTIIELRGRGDVLRDVIFKEMGDDHWELVTVVYYDGYGYSDAYFKRMVI